MLLLTFCFSSQRLSPLHWCQAERRINCSGFSITSSPLSGWDKWVSSPLPTWPAKNGPSMFHPKRQFHPARHAAVAWIASIGFTGWFRTIVKYSLGMKSHLHNAALVQSNLSASTWFLPLLHHWSLQKAFLYLVMTYGLLILMPHLLLSICFKNLTSLLSLP